MKPLNTHLRRLCILHDFSLFSVDDYPHINTKLRLCFLKLVKLLEYVEGKDLFAEFSFFKLI